MIRVRMGAPCSPLATALLALALGCGDSTSTVDLVGASADGSAAVEISGNVVSNPAAGGSVLVFGFADLPADANLEEGEPTSLAVLGEDGGFELSSDPAAKMAVVFLADTASDGVIDPGDPAAVLGDPEGHLQDLHEGDVVRLLDVQLNFADGSAAADSIEVRCGHASEEATTAQDPTPE